MSDKPMHDEIPSIDGFQMIERRAHSATSSLWQAHQIALGRTVMIKILSEHLSHDPEDVKQFKFEARVTASLKHNGIVQVYDFGEIAQTGRHYFVMEYISGYSVGDWLRRKGKLTESDSLVIAHNVADALQYAWDHYRIIHCDIKPDNIMVDGDGTVKVTDLGLAKAVSTIGVRPGDSDEVIIMGTPNYMSPEQVMGETNLDCRADIYSLGATLYHSLTGILPFDEDDPSKVMQRRIEETLEHPQKVDPAISTDFSRLIMKMMAKHPDDRYQNWNEVLNGIVRVGNKLNIADEQHVLGTKPGATVDRSEKKKHEKPKSKVRIKYRERTEPISSSVSDVKPMKRKVRRSATFGGNLRILASVCLLIFLIYYGYNRMVNNRDILLPVRIRIMREVVPLVKLKWRELVDKYLRSHAPEDLLPVQSEQVSLEAEDEAELSLDETIMEKDADDTDVGRGVQTPDSQQTDSLTQTPEFQRILRLCEQSRPVIGDEIRVKLLDKEETIGGVIDELKSDGIVLKVEEGRVECPFAVMSDKTRLLFFPEERARKLIRRRQIRLRRR